MVVRFGRLKLNVVSHLISGHDASPREAIMALWNVQSQMASSRVLRYGFSVACVAIAMGLALGSSPRSWRRVWQGGATVPKLERSVWYDLYRDMNCHFRYVTEAEVFPEALS